MSCGEKLLSVELVPPGKPDLVKTLKRISEIAGYACAVNVPDTPLGMPRVSGIIVSAVLATRFPGLTVIPHFKTVDVDWVAAKSLLLGLYAAGIRTVLVVRGDPPAEGRGVDEVDPCELVRWIRESLPDMNVGIGVGVNGDISYYVSKLRANPDFVMTQPIFTVEKARAFLFKLGAAANQLGYRPRVYATFLIPSPRNEAVIESIAHEIGDSPLPASSPRDAASAAFRLLSLFDGLVLSSPRDWGSLVETLRLLRLLVAARVG